MRSDGIDKRASVMGEFGVVLSVSMWIFGWFLMGFGWNLEWTAVEVVKLENGESDAEIEGIVRRFTQIEKHLMTSTRLVHSRGRI